MPSRDDGALLTTLEARFVRHMPRHCVVQWSEVQERLHHHPAALYSLAEMEAAAAYEPEWVASIIPCGRHTNWVRPHDSGGAVSASHPVSVSTTTASTTSTSSVLRVGASPPRTSRR